MKMNNLKSLVVVVSTLGFCLLGAQTANAILIGAGSGIAVNELDNGGSRLNIDGNYQSLAAGTYQVTDYGYNANSSGVDLQPFLAALTGSNTYEVIWIGSVDSSGSGVVTTSFASGSEQFTLSGLTDVFAGFNDGGSNIYFNNQGGSTDHNNPANFSLGVGDTISGLGYSDLPRTYAFEVNVATVPDGGFTLILLGFGLAGLAALKRRIA